MQTFIECVLADPLSVIERIIHFLLDEETKPAQLIRSNSRGNSPMSGVKLHSCDFAQILTFMSIHFLGELESEQNAVPNVAKTY